MNKQIKTLTGVTEEDFIKWCKENNKPVHSTYTRQYFFERIVDGRLVKDSRTGKIVRRKRK